MCARNYNRPVMVAGWSKIEEIREMKYGKIPESSKCVGTPKADRNPKPGQDCSDCLASVLAVGRKVSEVGFVWMGLGAVHARAEVAGGERVCA